MGRLIPLREWPMALCAVIIEHAVGLPLRAPKPLEFTTLDTYEAWPSGTAHVAGYRKGRDALKARVEVLTAALTEILELIEYQDRPVARIKVRARAALAAGTTESDNKENPNV
jgi:hypothetical protein